MLPNGTVIDEPIALSIQDAIKRGIQFNLGAIGAGEGSRRARAQRLPAIAQLLPDLTGAVRESVQQENLSWSRMNVPAESGFECGL